MRWKVAAGAPLDDPGFDPSSRYCPQCLAGDPASPVQQRFGGAWNKLWRLPVVFACLAHQRLLEDTSPATDPPDGLGHMLRFQRHLLRLLDPHGPAATSGIGESAAPGQYVNDLRILACLIIASWPAARDLARSWQAELISQHAAAVRRQIEATRGTRRPDWQISFYDTPPALHRWVKWFLAGDGYCSPAFRAAAGPAVGARHVIQQTTARSSPRDLHPPPRPDARYTIAHIPAYLPAGWYGQHLARFAGLAPQQMLRRAAAIHLARTCTPGQLPAAGRAARHPGPGSKASPHRLRQAPPRPQELGDQPQPVEPADQWPQPAAIPAPTWGDRKRMLGLRLGLGLHHQRRAPVRSRGDGRPGRTPQPSARRPRPPALHQPPLARPDRRNPGPLRALRQRLDAYADQIAARIDNSPSELSD